MKLIYILYLQIIGMFYIVFNLILCYVKKQFINPINSGLGQFCQATSFWRIKCFVCENNSSHGMKSGEYGGRNRMRAPVAFKASKTSCAWCMVCGVLLHCRTALNMMFTNSSDSIKTISALYSSESAFCVKSKTKRNIKKNLLIPKGTLRLKTVHFLCIR